MPFLTEHEMLAQFMRAMKERFPETEEVSVTPGHPFKQVSGTINVGAERQSDTEDFYQRCAKPLVAAMADVAGGAGKFGRLMCASGMTALEEGGIFIRLSISNDINEGQLGRLDFGVDVG